MRTFLIVDDNTDHSETVQGHISDEFEKMSLSDSFQVVTTTPFEDFENYFQLINENNTCVLILDERLNEKNNAVTGKPVDYLGHDLVTAIRERQPDLPIYTITNYSTAPEVQNVFSEYEQIISRKDFYDNPEKYVPVMLRAGSKFLDRYNAIISEFTQLSQELASGDKSPEKRKRLEAIQTIMELPLFGFDDRQTWLNAYEEQLKELETLKASLTDNHKKR